MNGMVISAAPMKSMGAVTLETKPGMTEKEKSDIEEELERIKLRLQKTERELEEEKKLTRSQVCRMPTTKAVALQIFHGAQKGKNQKVRSPTGYVLGAAAKNLGAQRTFLGAPGCWAPVRQQP